MSNKSKLFELLNLFPESLTDAIFPELSVPADPSTVEDAILASAKANIEIVKHLNAYKGIKVRELYGMVGMLAPAAQAIAGGFLQSDGTSISGANHIVDAIKMIGDESSGGGITGIVESIARREASGGSLALLTEAASFIPVLGTYGDFLTPMINVALDWYGKPGRIAEQCGYILLDNICDLIKQIIVNELFPDLAPEGSAPLVNASLGKIAKSLRTTDHNGYDSDVPIGSLLQALQRRFAYINMQVEDPPDTTEWFPDGTADVQAEWLGPIGAGVVDWLYEFHDTFWCYKPEGENEGQNIFLEYDELFKEWIDLEKITEINGTRVWSHSKVIDGL
jgi:hypothetical protein